MNRYIGLIVVAWLSSASLYGANLPSGFFETEIAAGLSNPTAMALAPDGRIFVCEQWGSLRVIKNGTLLSTSFLDLAVSFPTNGEAGLLGVAVDPNFTSNQYLYVYYTATTPAIHNRISRFTAAGDVAVPGTEVVILELGDLSNAIAHNGGAIHFGPDGKLYAAVGENGFGPNAQTLNNLLGKILRLNPDGTIPADNPFYYAATGNNRAIWALGLRNPYTFAFQPGTGRMFINDVGHETWEEINDGIAGSNYGWPDTEGPTNESQYRTPFFAYSHGGTPSGCAITGGVFYNPSFPTFPAEYLGDYFFSDLCSGWINRLDPNDGSIIEFATDVGYPLNLQVGPDGSLYYLAFGLGSVFRIDYTANPAPSITRHPASQTVSVGQPATFTVTASGNPPLSFQWQRNGNDISGANFSSYTIAATQFSDNGALLRCVVANSFGSTTSNEAVLTVTGNSLPTGSITQPTAGTIYTAGNTIGYAGIGTDSEDGTLPPSAFTWRVDFHHNDHFHPFVPPTSGSQTGSFVIPTTGETSPNVWYRIHLTVQDSAGLTHSSFRDILPRVSTVNLATVPSGLQIKLDGQPVTTPFSFVGVAGLMRNLEAVSPQNVNATTWTFASWSDGGAAAHNIATPGTNTTLTATYTTAATTAPAGDFDGDVKADITVYRPSTGDWWSLLSSTNYTTYKSNWWGHPGDVPVPADFDGDGKTDLAIYRPSDGTWWSLLSNTNYTTYKSNWWGHPGDVPVPADYDGDGKTDLAIYRPSDGTWWILWSSTNDATYKSNWWGHPGDVPVPADYDGDGKTDLAIYRPSDGTWWSLLSSTNYTTYKSYGWGHPGDVPVPADYDGDGKTDIAIYRPSTGWWWVLWSSSNYSTYNAYGWGLTDDVPVPADYDGDGKTDIAIYRPSTGDWWILWSSSNYITYSDYRWGSSGDIPTLKRP